MHCNHVERTEIVTDAAGKATFTYELMTNVTFWVGQLLEAAFMIWIPP